MATSSSVAKNSGDTVAGYGASMRYVDSASNATIFETDSNGKINISNIFVGTYYVEEVSTKEFYEVSSSSLSVRVDRIASYITESQKISTAENESKTAILRITNTRQTGNLEIIKVDEDTNNPMRDIGFVIKHQYNGYLKVSGKSTASNSGSTPAATGANLTYTSSKSQATQFRTDSSGKIDLVDIPTGTYTLEEVYLGTYRGYQTKTVTVTVSRESSEYTIPRVITSRASIITVKNKQKLTGNIEFTKKDGDTNAVLSGIEVVVKDSSGSYLRFNDQDYITNGYVDVMSAEKYPSISYATKIKTDSNGKIRIEYIPIGTYTIEEYSNNRYGYVIDSQCKVSTTVTQDQTSYPVLNNYTQTGNLEITKIERDTRETMQGIGFKIRNSSNKYLQVRSGSSWQTQVQNTTVSGENINFVSDASQATEFLTDASGKIRIIRLMKGTYYIEETSVGNYYGYNLLPSSTSVTVARTTFNDTSNYTKVTIENSKTMGDLEITKTDGETGVILPNVTFRIKNSSSQYLRLNNQDTITTETTVTSMEKGTSVTRATILKTDAAGKIKLNNLLVGSYYLEEVSNNHYGYTITNSNVRASVSLNRKTTQTVTNEKQTGNLEIVKVDRDIRTPMVGVEFKIKRNGQYMQVLDDNGQVKSRVEGITFARNLRYVSDKGSGTTFVTNSAGRIFLVDIITGTYAVEETYAGNYYGYQVNTSTPTITVYKENANYTNALDESRLLSHSSVITVENTKNTGNLEVRKINKDTKEPMSDISFKIRKKEGTSQWIQVYDENGQFKKAVRGLTYARTIKITTDKNAATEFITDDNGKIYLIDIAQGNYVVEESSTEKHYGYELSTTNLDITVQHQSPAYTTTTDLGVIGSHTSVITIENEKKTGNLEIVKTIDGTNNVTMSGVGFKIKDSDNQYIQILDIEGKVRPQIVGRVEIGTNVDFTKNKNEATEFVTDSSGKIQILNILMGTYTIEETSLGENDGFDLKTDSDKITIKKELTKTKFDSINIKNIRKYVNISGIVWEDIAPLNKRAEEKNNVLETGSGDTNDKRLKGVQVQLKEGDKVIKTEYTDDQGKYVFRKLEFDQLPKYKIEFEYNGLSYQCVPLVTEDSTNNEKVSRATENTADRDALNNRFERVVKGKAVGNGTETPLTYDSGNYKSTLKFNDNVNQYNYGYSGNNVPVSGVYDWLKMKASTENAKKGGLKAYLSDEYIEEVKAKGIQEITGFNLGLYKRQQPNLRIGKELEQVKVVMNSMEHIYTYSSESTANRFSMDPTVKFGEEYSDTNYTRGLYPSDIKYNGGKDLKVYATYRIAISNTSSGLVAVVNEIADYFDSKFNFIKVTDSTGKELTKGNVTTINGEYNCVRISNMNLELDGNSRKDLLVELEVQPEQIINIVGTNDNYVKLDNIVEITSYTTKQDGKIYAGVDQNSQPDNLNVSNIATFEDDTDNAPGLKIVLQEERSVKGTVFIDDTGELKIKTNTERNGDGEFKTGEVGLAGVTVKLLDSAGNVAKVYEQSNFANIEEYKNNNNWADAITTTNNNGDYTIAGFLPGEYSLQFEWGGQTYKVNGNDETVRVQDYKGTIYKESDRQNNVYWYKTTTPRYSDAMDNINTRKSIDAQTTKVNSRVQRAVESYNEGDKINNTDLLIRTMQSNTPKFKVDFEYNGNTTDSNNEYLMENGRIVTNGIYATKKPEYRNEIINADFGIAKRPMQQLGLSKRIKRAKITLSNGTVLVDAEMVEDANGNLKLKNPVDHTVYLAESQAAAGQLKMELDSEIIQGSTLEITYQLQLHNDSEIDYVSDSYSYYLYGQKNATDQTVALGADQIIDYLDNNISITGLEEQGWEEMTATTKQQLVDRLGWTEEMKNWLNESGRSFVTSESTPMLKPGEKLEDGTTIVATKLITNTTKEINVNNNAEIIEISKTGGASLETTPGNYIPTKSETHEADDGRSENVSITPPTGLTTDIILYTVIAIAVLGVTATGIILIKKYAVRK